MNPDLRGGAALDPRIVLTLDIGGSGVKASAYDARWPRTIASVGISSQLDRTTALALAHDMQAAARAVGQGTAIAR